MKRTIALALSAAAICGIMLTAGCGRNGQNGNHTGASPSGSAPQTSGDSMLPDGADGSDSQPAETGGAPPSPQNVNPATVKPSGFEDLSFGGKTFRIAASEGRDPRWQSAKEIYSDESDTISNAVRERNTIVESLYDCTIEMIPSEDPVGLTMAEVTANQHTIDVFSATGFGKSLAENGNIYNLYNIGIDFSHEWWDQTFVSTYTVKTAGGRDTLFAMMGDFCLSAFAATHAIIYNQNVMETSGFSDDVHELIRNNEWTVDRFSEMIRVSAKDASGNSVISFAEGDILGWARTGHAAHGLHTASALPLIETKNGSFVFSPAGDPNAWVGIIDRAIGVWSTPGAETLGYTNVQKALASNRTLFASEVIDVLERMKDAEDVRVGLLPYPLYSPSQERYAHYVDNHVFTYHVPVSVSETEEIGKFMEVFGYHSRHTVRKAFINAYGYGYCSDPQSAEMLALILDTRSYDPGYHYWSAAESDLSQMIASAQNNVVKWTQRREASVSEEIGNYVSRISGFGA
ncbi:MAG: hypothetical protein IJD59_03150 [Clostridia bacterium]|nr:hypothetical protein [Clostridia bacterium]